MPRPSISTRTGDSGSTGLFGGRRVSKASPRLHAYGTVDELNALLGVILAGGPLPQAVADTLVSAQRTLFCIGADLATPHDSRMQVDRVTAEAVERLEGWGAALESALPPLTKFVLPGGSTTGALCHQARTVCRRAERWVIALAEHEEVNEHVIVYLNRLSDYLFLAARFANKNAAVAEREWRGETH